MKLPCSQRWPTLAAFAFAIIASSSFGASAKDFDGMWSVSIVAEDQRCPTHTIPVQVSDGTISFSGFGAEATGKVARSGAIRMKISLNETVVRIDGTARGRVASGSWHTAPAGCGGHWSAQIAD